MPESLDIDPSALRRLATQHDQISADIEEWSKPPTDWLKDFPNSYGPIADPVWVALKDYYSARERAGLQLATEHAQIARSLRAAADSYENVEADSGSRINRAGDLPDDRSLAPIVNPMPMNGGGPVNARESSPQPQNSAINSVAASGTAAAPTTASNAGMPGAPVTNSAAPMPGAPVTNSASPMEGLADSRATAGTISASTDQVSTGPGTNLHPAAGGTPPGLVSGYGLPGADDRGAAGTVSSAVSAVGMPVLTPFGAAVAAARDKASEPSFVLGNTESEDLVIAKTLLQSVLSAVDSPVGMAWAVSVMRGPAGAGVFITTNEGRGWLPTGLFLPREVSTPWLWDEVLEDQGGSPWEGISDPARVLVEFGLAWGRKANAALSALVSSGPIDPGLRAQLPDVPVEGLVGPADAADLRIHTPDTTDRLGIGGSIAALKSTGDVPDDELHDRRLRLALHAHSSLGRATASSVEAIEARRLREQILAVAQAGQPVPAQWWDELREADDLVAVGMLSRRVDVARVAIGELRFDDEVSALRALLFERRCNELVLLLAQEPTRQSLRDARYAYDQIIAHPKFVETHPSVSVTETEQDTGRTIDTSAANAGALAGPPSRTVLAPSSSPPPTMTATS